MPDIQLLNCDCMEYMAKQPDNAFDLAIVDPPYGLERLNKPGRLDRNGDTTKWNGMKPKAEYWSELFRVSKNQIVWGANNFQLPPTEYFCIWDKAQTVDNFATAEYAWVSMGLKKPAKIYRYSIHQHNSDHLKGGKIHPTQKPISLYEWLLKNYAEPNQKILDTHLGSGSSAIAAHYFGCDFVGCEIDEDYYKAATARFDAETRQEAMF